MKGIASAGMYPHFLFVVTCLGSLECTISNVTAKMPVCNVPHVTNADVMHCIPIGI